MAGDVPSFPECEQFARVRPHYTLCRGERLTPEKCDRWRVSRGLPPLFSGLPDYALRQSIRVVVPAGGPGTEFKALIESLKVPTPAGCNCEALRIEMDKLGVTGCRRERGRLLLDIKANAGKVSWLEKLKAVAPAITTGLVFTLDPLDPIGSMFDEAVNIAERKQAQKKRAARRSKSNRAASAGRRRRGGNPFTMATGTPRFITTGQLMADAKALASKLPIDTVEIIGIARSGLCVATMVAMLLHRPLNIFRQSMGDLIEGGNGWRLSGAIGDGVGKGTTVVIDDTCMTGNSFKHVMPIIRQTRANAISAAVYVNPNARLKPDLWAVDLPWPHILEWNMFNSILSPSMAVDFDGILCHDCQPGEDDDGPRYLNFLQNARPLYLARKVALPMIVTARLEKYRPQTMAWLERYGVTVNKLVMGPWKTLSERRRSDVAAYKAEHFRAFLKRHRGIKPAMFVESDHRQAEQIARMSRGLVACPAAGRCYQ